MSCSKLGNILYFIWPEKKQLLELRAGDRMSDSHRHGEKAFIIPLAQKDQPPKADENYTPPTWGFTFAASVLSLTTQTQTYLWTLSTGKYLYWT